MPTNHVEGQSFLRASAAQHDSCAAESTANLSRLSPDVQRVLELTGQLLFLADAFASCWWGCHGKEHVIEYLVGRTVSNARAALRLIEFGQYDEALALTRNIAEIGNLLWLFSTDVTHLRSWLDSTEKRREEEYSPLSVRRKLEALGATVPHDQDAYGNLCRIAVHPHPSVRPQAHNVSAIPTLGGFYQEQAYVSCLRQLGWALSSVTGPAAKLAILDQEQAEMIVNISIELAEATIATGEEVQDESTSSDRLRSLTRIIDERVRKIRG